MNKIYRIIKRIKWIFQKWRFKYQESNIKGDIKLSHVTYYAVKNVGDTVLSQCVRNAFSLIVPNAKWYLVNVGHRVTERTISNINSTEALIIGGGGLFLPDTNQNDISGWQWAIEENQLASVNVPVIVFSVGYNYFPGQIPTDLFIRNLILLCNKADFIGLRNHGSVEAVKRLLPEHLQNKIIFQPCVTTVIRKIFPNIPAKKKSNIVAFNLAFDREELRFGAFKDKICRAIAKAALKIEQRGYKIFLVYHCETDRGIKPFMDLYDVKYEEKDLSTSFPKEAYLFYNNIECVLGMRGHAQMIPFGLNCEIISLGSHDKMKWFLDDIEASDWYIDLMENRECLDDVITERFINIHENNNEITHQRLIDAQEKLWKVTKTNLSIIKSLI